MRRALKPSRRIAGTGDDYDHADRRINALCRGEITPDDLEGETMFTRKQIESMEKLKADADKGELCGHNVQTQDGRAACAAVSRLVGILLGGDFQRAAKDVMPGGAA